jgi:hypothetical protein
MGDRITPRNPMNFRPLRGGLGQSEAACHVMSPGPGGTDHFALRTSTPSNLTGTSRPPLGHTFHCHLISH